MTDFAFKTFDGAEAPTVSDRKVRAVIGRVNVVDYDNEMLVGDSFKIGGIRCSRWMHNSMPLAKLRGLVDEIEEPVGYGKGWVDGDKIIGEVDVMKGARGDAFLEHVRTAGEILGYSHGFSIKNREVRPDGVTLLHGACTTEMSPVPDASVGGTGTLAAMLGMKIDESVVEGAVADAVKTYFASDAFKALVADGLKVSEPVTMGTSEPNPIDRFTLDDAQSLAVVDRLIQRFGGAQ